MSVQSKLSEIAARKIGTLQGEIEARINEQVLDMLGKFANSCPTREALTDIINLRNNLLTAINQFEKTVDKFKNIINQLRAPIKAAKVLKTLLERNPVPSAVIFHPGGKGVSLGRITKLAGRHRTVSKLLEALEDDVESINGLINGVQPSLNSVRNILNSVDIKILECAEELDNAEDLVKLLEDAQEKENTGSEGIPNENYKYRAKNGRDYTLHIIEDISIKTTIPRRIAVAKDIIGVTVLQGQPSFSSSTKVLLDELKFRIDNQLP